MSEDFNIEDFVPHEELAKMQALHDIEDDIFKRRLTSAMTIFEKVDKFMLSQHGVRGHEMLKLAKPKLEKLLQELNETFIKAEEYHQCGRIIEWKKILNSI